MNELLHLSTAPVLPGGGRGKCRTVTPEDGSHPESCSWLGLGNKCSLVKDGERSWFGLIVNKHTVSQVTPDIFFIKPDQKLNQVL